MERYKLYEESQNRFRKLEGAESTNGFMNWEQYFDNFKLECWNSKNPKTKEIEPIIIQFWQDGQGYQVFRQEQNTVSIVKYDRNDILKIAENMARDGGSFVKNLAQCIYKADDENLDKLGKTFPEYFAQYLKH